MKHLVFIFILISNHVFTQGTMLLREPTISKDYIAFVYANDIWLTSVNGGDAKRLTSNVGLEANPHFSPDGEWIAFTGQYDGNTDVFIIPKDGGEPKRLTFHPGPDRVTGWTPDGNSVLFASTRDGVLPTKESKIYKVNKEGGHPEALIIPRAVKGEISENGQYIAYQQIDFWDPEWRNYRGGQAKPIWIVDLKTLDLQQTRQTDNERHTDPVWLNNIIYHLSERDFANNIWSYNPITKEEKQITFHKNFDIKSLDAGGDRIVYEQGGYLHVYTPSTQRSIQLTVNVKADFNYSREKWVDVSASNLLNGSLSPTGKRAIFEHRGEIITIPKEHGAYRNVTNTSKSAERSPVWSPDGKSIAYFSDVSGEYQLIIADQDGTNKKTIAIPNPTFFFKPVWSPDGKFLAFTDTDYNLRITTISSGSTIIADTDRYAHPNRSLNPVWSPDSKWVTYVKLGDNHFKRVKVYNVNTGKSHELTDGMADAISPVWDADGKYLYFLASTNYGLNTGWLDMSSYERPLTRSLYAIALTKSTPSPIMPKTDEEKVEIKKEDDAKPSAPTPKPNTNKKPKATAIAPPKDTSTTDKSKKVEVLIDFDDIESRIVAIDLPEKNYTDLYHAPEGMVFIETNSEGQNSISRYNFKVKKIEVHISGANYFTVSNDRKSTLYRSGSTWGILNSTDNNKKSGDGKLENASNIKIKILPQEEWQQIYKEAWRYQRDFLYVDNVHGAPWNDIYKWYLPWVEHVRHRSDLNYIVDILGGEVAVGHSYTNGGDIPASTVVNIGLLGADYEVDNGYYKFKKIYNGESWNPNLKAPLRGPGLNVNIGHYILEVNGIPLTANDNIYQAFENTADKATQIRINDKPTLENSKVITVVPIGSELQLRNIHWQESNRRKVDSLSNGQLAYVYVPNTGNGGYTNFNRYYFAQQDKKGVIIDERNNGGGSAADYMVDIMARSVHGYFNSRASDKRPFITPNAGIFGPKVMLINERAGSGGDLLPYMFHRMKLGTLVGTKTWGGLVGTWDTPPFVDGGRMVAPRGGFYDNNGEWAVEGEGIAPDVLIEQTPKDVINGRDPQLEKAIEIALKQIDSQYVPIKPEPKAPVRYKRP
jgi:tricorn protease